MTQDKERAKKFKGKKTVVVLCCLAAVYLLAAWLLLRFALVPAFMEKFEAFERLTEIGYSEQVYTDDIVKNSNELTELRNQWLETVDKRKLAADSEDGYQLIAMEFTHPQNETENAEKRPWAVLLHGYTGRKSEMYALAYLFYEQGYNVLTPDLRAQGESEGECIFH